MIVHLIFMLILALITFKSTPGTSILLTFRQGGDAASPELATFSIEPVDWKPAEEDLTTWPSPAEQTLEFAIPLELPQMERLENRSPLAGLDALNVPLAAAGSPPLSSMFAGRSGPLKKSLLKSGGGTAETEDAVALGLVWLKRQQLKDGAWSMRGPFSHGGGAENQTAATAMAMLAFMGAGNTHKSGEYKAEVYRAVKWLVAQQDRQGFMAAAARDNEKMYAQAQATIALCELYGMTRDYWLKPYAQKACDFACDSQSSMGGWRYRPKFDSDTSVTGWFVMGLKSGQAAGLSIRSHVFPKVEQYLDSVSGGYDSGYAYQVGRRPSPSMTAEGILCRQYLGWHRNMPGMAQGLGALVANHALDRNQQDVYYWYYATQALHHYGGPLWEEWNDILRVTLPETQDKQGRESGSWSPQRDAWGRHAGRLYTTCLSLYCLEVYYRHLPLYSSESAGVAAK
ncbi:MAG: terpene cyclase/mutase family protein [Planctomycetales bacterium]|nr:terpene cyclase/mutase family protein [Planctomycetales bacterium]